MQLTPPREKRAERGHAGPATIRIRASRNERLPRPGNWIEREYKGVTIRVLVLTDGFESEGQRYGYCRIEGPHGGR